MYTWRIGRARQVKGQSLTLRPENTAGVVRAYIEHKLWGRGLNKLYYIGPQFRRERPQKGRYRQFYQIGAEVIGPASAGSASPARDAEVLEMLATLLDRLGVADWNLELNSVGTPADRAQFNEALREALGPVAAQMCEDCQRRAVTNPLRVFDCKVPADQPIIETLPRITEFLGEESLKHFETVHEILRRVGVGFHMNDRLVRASTTTRVRHSSLRTARLERRMRSSAEGATTDCRKRSAVRPLGDWVCDRRRPARDVVEGNVTCSASPMYIAPMAGMNAEAARLARELRRHDLVVELGDDAFRLKKSFEAATKTGAKYILIVGGASEGRCVCPEEPGNGRAAVARGDLAARIRGYQGRVR
jgi:histidyl-tRNA synthetase